MITLEFSLTELNYSCEKIMFFLQATELGVSDTIEGGDQCKFVVWGGKASDGKLTLKANTPEVKQVS